MRSSELSSISAVTQLLLGLTVLFLPGVFFPGTEGAVAAHLATRLLAAAWLAGGALNWINRRTLLGGIYGRAIVVGNLTLYLVSSLALLTPAMDDQTPLGLRLLPLLFMPIAILYAMRLLRGPSERDFEDPAAPPPPPAGPPGA